MVISHNMMAMNAQRQFNITGTYKKKSTEKLSSGYRINRAADDAAGLAISEKMRRQIRGLNQAARNTQDGISMCQIADGALDEVSDMLHRITELSVESANGTLTGEERQYIQKEIVSILAEIDSVSENTEFNNQKIFVSETNSLTALSESSLSNEEIKDRLFNRTYPPIDTNVLADDTGDVILSDKANEMLKSLSDYAIAQTVYDNNWRTPRDTEKLRDVFQKWYDDVIQQRTDKLARDIENNPFQAGSLESIYQHDIANLESRYQIAMDAFESGNRNKICRYNSSGDGIAYNLFSYTKLADLCSYIGAQEPKIGNLSSIEYTAPFAFDAHEKDRYGNRLYRAKAGELNGLWFSMDSRNAAHGATSQLCEDKWDSACDIYRYLYRHQDFSNRDISKDSFWIQSGAEAGDGLYLRFGKIDTNSLGIKSINTSTQQGAKSAIESTKKALHRLSGIRSEIGAQQNRLEHSYNNVSNVAENTQAAESRIRDTDMAKEMVKFSLQNILEQAGISMIAQANQSNQGVLSLLQ